MFKTTYELFIKSLNGQHYVTLTTAPTDSASTTVRARVTTLHPLDSVDNVDQLKELTDCKPIDPTPAEKRAWVKWNRKMTKNGKSGKKQKLKTKLNQSLIKSNSNQSIDWTRWLPKFP